MKPIYHFMLLAFVASSCSKSWLETKSDKKLVTPTTVSDLQALLDNTLALNSGSFGLQQMAEVGTDNYFLEFNTWQSLPATISWQKNAYIFAKDIFEGERNVLVWNVPYTRVLYANIALDELPKVQSAQDDQNAIDNVKGSALFVRAHTYYWLSQIYSRPYHASTASADPGVPLRMNADFNQTSFRPNLQEVYTSIITDLQNAIPLLPGIPSNKTRPSKAACYGLLARNYLTMGDVDNALLYADSCLELQNALMDYNSIVATPTYPVPQYNEEVIYSDINSTSIFNPSRCRVDSVFYMSFAEKDLRKKVFFKRRSGTNYYSFNGSYDGSFQVFGGIATDEIILTRAECHARKGNTGLAMEDINRLLENRWEQNEFTLLTATDATDALEKVLAERRKELCFRGLRWVDLRRLNKEPGHEVTVTRILNGETYTLPPNDPKYVYPIPDDIISFTGMEQNER